MNLVPIPQKMKLSIAMLAITGLAMGCSSDSTGPEDDGNPNPGGEYSVILTYAGTGINGATPDGTSLGVAELSTPMDVHFSPLTGAAYIVDWNNHRILEVRSGRHYTVIGNGTIGSGEEGPFVDDPDTPQFEAGLNHPTHITWDPQGRIVLSAWHNSKIMRCDFLTGQMNRLAGLESEESNGNRCWNGDDKPGIEACLDLPVCTAFDSAGNLFIVDQKNLRIRRLNPVDGEITSTLSSGELSQITTVIGTGNAGLDGKGAYNGNDLPGVQTDLSAPGGQSAPPTSRMVIRGGEIYFCDTLNNMVRKLDPGGYVRLVAGGGLGLGVEDPRPKPGYTGDGGLATQATLNFPSDLAFDSAGNLYIADTVNNVVRKIDTNGVITTFAGTGHRYPPGGAANDVRDGGLPTEAYLDRPYGVAVDAQDNVYITDTFHNRIRVVYKHTPGR